nr:hypothetical protein CFP56_46244 [Quercus suber]
MKVYDLIDEDTRQWDRGKLAANILALPLAHQTSQDTLEWVENRARPASSDGYQSSSKVQMAYWRNISD